MADPLWSSQEIAAAVGGQEVGAFEVGGVSIDTRSLAPGDLFIPLASARDGHDFIPQARAAGATGVLSAKPRDGPHVRVEDPFAALQALGEAARQRPTRLACAAVTGSVGKTSVTQAIGAALALGGHGHASVKSYNNHIGVPLTLARMPRETERAVFEIGMNHADEISPLSRSARPDEAVIPTGGPVHIENFVEGELGVAKAKAEIFDGLRPGGTAVLNADNGWFDFLAERARAAGAEVLAFGRGEGLAARLIESRTEGEGQVVSAEILGRAVSFRLAQSGAHWGPNALATLLVCERLGLSQVLTLAALEGFGPLAGRGEVLHLTTPTGIAYPLIDESYNANPVSMTAVISAFGQREVVGRRILALTDMLELGADSEALHAALAGPIAAADIKLVYLSGSHMRALWRALPNQVRGGFAEEASQLALLIEAEMRPGDALLVKGSNGSRASALVNALRRGGRR